MKKIIYLIIFLPAFLLAQNPADNIQWAKVISADYIEPDPGYLLKADDSGNVLLFKTCYGTISLDHSPIGLPPVNSESVLFKFDSIGSLLFSKVMPASGEVKGLVVDQFNNIYVNYYSGVSALTSVIAKLDPFGNIIWRDSISNQDLLFAAFSPITVDESGFVYYGGANNGMPNYFNNDSLFNYTNGVGFFLLKINGAGNLINSELFSSCDTSVGMSLIYSIACNKSNNHIYLSGSNNGTLVFGSDSISAFPFFLELDSGFSLINKYLFGGSTNQFVITEINFDANNQIYFPASCLCTEVAVETDTFSFFNNIGLIFKLDEHLNHVWHKYIVDTLQGTTINSMSVNSGGNCYFTTYTHEDSIAIKLNSNGDFKWRFYFPGESNYFHSRAVACGKNNQLFGSGTINGQITINGNTYYPDSSSLLVFGFRDPDSLISVSEIPFDNSIVLFPNPTSSTFAIHSSIQFQNSEVEIFNLLGEKLYNRQCTIGNKEITIDVHDLSPGIYFVKVQTEKGNALQKLVIQ